MTQKAVDFKERLARLLAAVLATCRFTVSQDSYSANEVLTLYNSDRRRLPDELWARITSTTADRFFDLLKDEPATARPPRRPAPRRERRGTMTTRLL